jgi:hypothetical protein
MQRNAHSPSPLRRLRRHGHALARQLRRHAFVCALRWAPLAAAGGGLHLHVVAASLWLASQWLADGVDDPTPLLLNPPEKDSP